MFDLTNIFCKYYYGYYTEALLYIQLDLTTLLETFPESSNFSYRLMHTKKSKRKCYIDYFKEEQQKKKECDLHINIVQSKTNTFIIMTANHEKFDGCYLHENINAWSRNYVKAYTLSPIIQTIRNVEKCTNELNFLPININFVNKLKTKYNFSSYVIIVSIWTLYFKRKFNNNKFAQVVSLQKNNEGIGNYIYVNCYTITDEFASTCETIRNQVELTKHIKRNQFTYLLSHLNGMLRLNHDSIIFDSHTMFQHTMFPSLQSIFLYSAIQSTTTLCGIIPNLLFIGIQNECYVLYKLVPNLPMWSTDMSDFKEFCDKII